MSCQVYAKRHFRRRILVSGYVFERQEARGKRQEVKRKKNSFAQNRCQVFRQTKGFYQADTFFKVISGEVASDKFKLFVKKTLATLSLATFYATIFRNSLMAT